MENLIEILLAISGVCGSLVTVIGFITLMMKYPTKWARNISKEVCNEEFKELRNILKDIEKSMKKDKEGTLAVLRHSITDIYETYREKEETPLHVKKDLCSLYESYIAYGGNSYIVELFDIMHNWKIK